MTKSINGLRGTCARCRFNTKAYKTKSGWFAIYRHTTEPTHWCDGHKFLPSMVFLNGKLINRAGMRV